MVTIRRQWLNGKRQALGFHRVGAALGFEAGTVSIHHIQKVDQTRFKDARRLKTRI